MFLVQRKLCVVVPPPGTLCRATKQPGTSKRWFWFDGCFFAACFDPDEPPRDTACHIAKLCCAHSWPCCIPAHECCCFNPCNPCAGCGNGCAECRRLDIEGGDARILAEQELGLTEDQSYAEALGPDVVAGKDAEMVCIAQPDVQTKGMT